MPKDMESETKNNGFSDPEIDVDQLMREIRASIGQRGIDISAPFDPALAFSVQQPTPLAFPVPIPQLKLAPEFQPHADDCYHVNDLLRFHDSDFLRNAYEAILKREADEKGFRENLETLGSGKFNKIDVLGSLLYSKEGQKTGVKIKGLRVPHTLRRLERIPLLGYFLQLAVGLARLPLSIRNQRQFEAYVVSQQYLIANHIHEQGVELSRRLQQQGTEMAASLQENLDQVSAFREVVQARFDKAEDLLTQAEEQDRLLSERLNQAVYEAQQESQNIRVEVGDHGERLKQMQAEVHSLGILLQRSLPDTPAEREESQALYAAFEERFRGDPDEIRNRLKFYLPVIRDAVPEAEILDLGCGYGDWLGLLKENGHKARGVENNRFMVERCRLRGLEVIDEDVMVHLGTLPDNSVGVVTAFHLIEHLPFQTLIRLLGEVQRVLKPGGMIILETPNPENLVVAACNFYSDPTHHRPIYPHTLTFILDSKGFANLRLEYLHPVEESPFDADDPTLRALNTWFYGARDFAVIGRKN
jgi:SAM-dependent methyltransferase